MADTITIWTRDGDGYSPVAYDVIESRHEETSGATLTKFAYDDIRGGVFAVSYPDSDLVYTLPDWHVIQPQFADDLAEYSWVCYGPDGWSDDVIVQRGAPLLHPGAELSKE